VPHCPPTPTFDSSSEDIPSGMKEKSKSRAPSAPITDSSSENLLSQFQGEPQIVDVFTISQLTPREPMPGTATSGSSLVPRATTDFLKGTYVITPYLLSLLVGRESYLSKHTIPLWETTSSLRYAHTHMSTPSFVLSLLIIFCL
jgi:hypothetical protein